MNKFKIRTNSWHYKLLQTWGTSHYEIDRMMNFCSYWRKVVGCMIMTAIVLGFIALLAGLMIYAIVTAPIQSMGITLATIGILAACVGCTYGSIKVSQSFNSAYENSDSLIMTKYRSFKEKYCPMIEVSDD